MGVIPGLSGQVMLPKLFKDLLRQLNHSFMYNSALLNVIIHKIVKVM